jgi:alpha-tubulin suppressor-like RCC1 family protein
MSTRLRERATALWVAIFLVLAVTVAVVARLELVHNPKTSSPSANASLRLGPGAVRFRLRSALRPGAAARALAAGDYSSCALIAGKFASVYCWGDGARGQLGDGTRDSSLAPVPVQALPATPSAVAVGGSEACALLTDGRVACWGSNGAGREMLRPTLVPSLRGASAIAVGIANACAVVAGGAVDCWGSNSNGQLGDGKATAASARPVRVIGVKTARALAAGLAHTCALLLNGNVDCWGANTNGELGNGQLADSNVPVPVSGLKGSAVSIAAGDGHTCALLASGSVECWGWNVEGQLGNGGGDSSAPVQVSGLPKVRSISAGGNNTCALLRDGAVDCWGANPYGQLGNGTTSDSSSPVRTRSLGSGVVAITTGLYDSCALIRGGATTCWGGNSEGELGDGLTSSSAVPTPVTALGFAPDGSGTVSASPAVLASRTKLLGISFTYTAAAGGTHEGTLAITVPAGWTPPSINPGEPGFTSASAGRLSVDGRTIRVDGLSLATGRSLVVQYGHGAGGIRPTASGATSWVVREQSSPGGALSPLPKPTQIAVLAPDGSGTIAASASAVPSGESQRALRFVYTADTGGLRDGGIELVVPPGWSPPTTAAGRPGFTTASRGSVATRGRVISVTGVSLAGRASLSIVYRDGKAPSSSVGAQDWIASEQSGATGHMVRLGASAKVNVLAPDGSGSLTANPASVPNGARHVSITLTYSAASGGVRRGALTLVVPVGWSAPSTEKTAPGYVATTDGKIIVSGRTVTLLVRSLDGGATASLTYGSPAQGGPGAEAPTAGVGEQLWAAKERSRAAGKLRPLSSRLRVTVLSPDGSGSLLRATGDIAPGSHGNTIVFVFVAATGGISDGELRLIVPPGWTPASTDSSSGGYVTASPGTASMRGQTIDISGLSLRGGESMTIVYGNRSQGGAGATAPQGGVGPKVWRALVRSSATGQLEPLR